MSANRNLDLVYNCDDILELIPDYAFGLTDPETTQWIEANLSRCPQAAEHLADFRALQAEMRADVPQIDPPLALSGRLMVATAAPVVPTRRRVLRPVWLAAAAAVIALVITNIYWFVRVDDLSRRQTELLAMIQPNSNAFVLTDTSALHWARLADTSDQGKASAFMMWNGDNPNGLLYARGFPAGYVYHLWLTRDNERMSAGIFSVDADGNGALLFNISESIGKYTWARITIEPESGTPAPTVTPVVSGQL
jgi:Anti-sigma-K factor rskA, C-terminal